MENLKTLGWVIILAALQLTVCFGCYEIGYDKGYYVTYQKIRAMTADLLGAHKCQH